MNKMSQFPYRRNVAGVLDPNILSYGQYNITVSASNAYTNPDTNFGEVNISL